MILVELCHSERSEESGNNSDSSLRSEWQNVVLQKKGVIFQKDYTFHSLLILKLSKNYSLTNLWFTTRFSSVTEIMYKPLLKPATLIANDLPAALLL